MVDLKLIHELEIRKLATSNVDQRYIVCYKERNFEINETVFELIDLLKEKSSIDGLKEFYAKKGRIFNDEEIESIIENCLGKILKPASKEKSSPFIFNIELLSEKTIGTLSNILKVLFNKWISLLIMVAIVVLEILFFTNNLTIFNTNQIDLYMIIGLLGLFILSSFFHELGHASACRYFGVNHGGIGFGLYINFPVFYTDVSEVWQLPKLQKMVVNIAGIYFQLILLIPMFLIYAETGNNILKYYILSVNINMAITLNPFLKFDGYWIMSDLLGIPNLRQRTSEVFKYYFNRSFKKPINKRPYLLAISKKQRTVAIIYTILVNLIFGFYFLYFIPVFIIKFFRTFPGHIKELIFMISTGSMPDLQLMQRCFGQLIFFMFTVYVLYKTLYPLVKKHLLKINDAAKTL
ncbi:MAG: hypothetical protein PUB21_11750 [Bacteroidales bacterium]|nr:hypothetical protein [Bacteroidales bacterium]